MAFWIAILVGALFAWLAVHRGFYEIWAMLFNVVISIYVALFLAPSLAQRVPASSYSVALSLLVVAGGIFALLQGLCFVFLTGQFSISLSRFFDIVVAGALGLATGFLIFSFVGLAVAATPLSDSGPISRLGFDAQSQSLNFAGLAWSSQQVHTLVGLARESDTAQAAVERILETARRTAPPESPDADESSKPSATGPQT